MGGGTDLAAALLLFFRAQLRRQVTGPVQAVRAPGSYALGPASRGEVLVLLDGDGAVQVLYRGGTQKEAIPKPCWKF